MRQSYYGHIFIGIVLISFATAFPSISSPILGEREDDLNKDNQTIHSAPNNNTQVDEVVQPALISEASPPEPVVDESTKEAVFPTNKREKRLFNLFGHGHGHHHHHNNYRYHQNCGNWYFRGGYWSHGHWHQGKWEWRKTYCQHYNNGGYYEHHHHDDHHWK